MPTTPSTESAGLEPAFIEAARALIAADSVTDRGNLPAVEVLEPLWREAGYDTRRQPSPTDPHKDANLLAGPGGGSNASGNPLLLVTHLDTVPPGPRDRWRTDPFTLTLDGDRAYGLGVADVKLDALCKLWAAKRLRDVPLKRPFWFLGTYGEEAGLRGAKHFVSNLPFRPEYVLCGEPTELAVYTAHKGYAVVRVRIGLRDGNRSGSTSTTSSRARWKLAFAGRAAHSSTPHLGINAIDRALDALTMLGDRPLYAFDGGAGANVIPAHCEMIVGGDAPLAVTTSADVSVERVTDAPVSPDLRPLIPIARAVRERWVGTVTGFEPLRNDRFEPAHAVANLNIAASGNGGIEFTLDARLLPEHDADSLVAGFRDALPSLENAAVEVTLVSGRSANGMGLSDDAPLVRLAGQALAAAGLDPTPQAKPTSTEGGVFVHAGFPAAIFGPSPSTGNAHTANEHARLDEVARAIHAYESLIRHLCGASS